MVRKANDYSNGKVYFIRNTVNDKVYIGSSTQPLCKRMVQHRSNAKTQNTTIYQNMREIGIKKFYIELLELCPCETKEQLNKREGELIREHNTVVDGYNSTIPGRTYNEWREEKKDELAEYNREYQQTNKDKLTEYIKQYYQMNKRTLVQKQREYYQANKEESNRNKREKRRENRQA
jgi:group I intron endonuclease